MIALEGVAKSYPSVTGRKLLLDNVSADFPPGYNFGILGANGAGKSTLIRLLAGSEMPDRGAIRRDARVSFPLGFGGTFHGALSRYYGANPCTGCRGEWQPPIASPLERCRTDAPVRPAIGRCGQRLVDSYL